MFKALRRWLHKRRPNPLEYRWRRLARSVTRHTFLTWLAEQVAKDLLKAKPSSVTIIDLSERVIECPSDDFQHRAERFIEKFYFDYPFYTEDYFPVIAEFRHLIAQHLTRMHHHDAATD
jgi:hypothetical protein